MAKKVMRDNYWRRGWRPRWSTWSRADLKLNQVFNRSRRLGGSVPGQNWGRWDPNERGSCAEGDEA